ncbi:MAG: 5'-nucleotidase [Pseudomonadota bacterium]
MTTRIQQSAILLPLLLGLPNIGCILCNEEFPEACMENFNTCEGDKGAVLGQTQVELDLRKSVVRTREAPVGNLVADAFHYTANLVCQRNGVACPDAAFQNGGGIRSQTACGERELIPIGALYERDVNQMLPFGNLLTVTEVSGWDLKLALEHSVDELGLPGKAGQSGHFLQVSRLRFEVDCRQAPHAADSSETQITTPGARIADGSLYIRTDDGSGPDEVWTPVDTTKPTLGNPGTLYRIALSGFIGSGNDGFLAFVLRDQDEIAQPPGEPPYLNKIIKNLNGEEALRDDNDAQITDAMAVMKYIQAKKKVAPDIEYRIVARNCVAGVDE